MAPMRILSAAVLATCLLPAQDAGPQTGFQNRPKVADAAAARQQPGAIAVVDVMLALDQYPKWIKKRAELDKLRAEFGKELQKLDEQIDELRATLPVIDPEDPARPMSELNLQMLQAQKSGLSKVLASRFDVEQARATVECFEDIETAIRKVATQRGVQLVLRKQDLPPADKPVAKLGNRDLDARFARMMNQVVLFAGDEIDLTGDVIKLLQVPLQEAPGATSGGSDKVAPAQPQTPKGGG